MYLKKYVDIKKLWWCVSYVREKTDDKILKIRIFTKNIKTCDFPCFLVTILIQILLSCRPNKNLQPGDFAPGDHSGARKKVLHNFAGPFRTP